MDIHRLGLIDSLFRIIDHADLGNSDRSIAEYFLKNYERIGELNIYEVAEECFVSRSSIRRFCQQICYDNFLEFKKEFKNFDYQYNYFMNIHKRENYRSWYGEEIMAMNKEIDELISQEMLERIVKRIHDSDRVVFLSSYSSSQCVMEFQRPLVLLNKIVQVMTDTNFSEEILCSLEKQDCLFMVSTTGNFARTKLDTLKQCHTYKAIITTSHDPQFETVFDDVYYLSKDDYSNEKTVRGKFGVLYLFDLLYNVYLKTYRKE